MVYTVYRLPVASGQVFCYSAESFTHSDTMSKKTWNDENGIG